MALFFRDNGKNSSETLLLLHGMAGSSHYWDRFISQLPTTWRVVAIDLLGFGRSPKPRAVTYTYETHIEAIVELTDILSIERATVVGHSMGALLALRLAVWHPERVNRLLLAGMPLFPDAATARYEITHGGQRLWKLIYYGPTSNALCHVYCSWLRPLTKHLAPLYLPYLPRIVAQDTLLHTWQAYAQSLQYIIEGEQPVQDLKRITAPVELVYGRTDPMVVRNRVASLQAALPNLNIKIMPGGHQLPNEAPEALSQTLIQFTQTRKPSIKRRSRGASTE